MFSVNNFRIAFAHVRCIRHFITQLVQGFHDDFKGFTLVMALQVFDVFQNKDSRLLGADNARDIKRKAFPALHIRNRAPGRVNFSCLLQPG